MTGCMAGQVSENPKTRPQLVRPVAPMLCGKCPSFGAEAGSLNVSAIFPTQTRVLQVTPRITSSGFPLRGGELG